MCPEGAGVPGVETGQYPPQSGSALADKVLTQPRGTDNDSTRIWSKAFSSSVTPTAFQVLSSVMWPGATVWTKQMFKKSRHHREFYWTFHARSLKGYRGNTCPQGGFACVVLIHRYLHVLSFLLLFNKAKDLRISCLLSYQLVAQCGLAQWRREPHFILLTHISESAFCPKSFHGAYIFRANSKLFYLNSVLFMVLQSWPLPPNLSSHLFFPPNDTDAITPHTHTENGPFNICVLSHISSSENTQTQQVPFVLPIKSRHKGSHYHLHHLLMGFCLIKGQFSEEKST